MTVRHGALRTFVAHACYQALLVVLTPVATLIFVAKNTVRGTLDADLMAWAFGRLSLGAAAFPARAGRRPVWVHAVSVGEVRACAALVEALSKDGDVVVSTATPTGLATARELFGERAFVAPLDLGWCVGRIFRRLDPRALLLVELEVWPTLLRHANRREVPALVVSGRITANSARRYDSLSWWLPTFERVDLIAAQDETIAERFVAVGVPAERVHVAGNLKHEGTRAADPATVASLSAELGLDRAAEPVLVIGSTHEGEDELALSIWEGVRAACGPVRLVLVPRHPPRVPAVAAMIASRGQAVTLRTAVRHADDWAPGAVLLVDTVGELAAFFALCDVVFLGGSLVPVGGHNVLEPAIARRPQVVGPHLDSCRSEALRLQAAGALWIVADVAEAITRMTRLIEDDALRRAAGERGAEVVASLSGATAEHVRLLAPWLSGRH